MKKLVSTLAALMIGGSLVTAIGCFIRMMFYTNIPKQTEVAFYVSCGIMFVYLLGFILMAGDADV